MSVYSDGKTAFVNETIDLKSIVRLSEITDSATGVKFIAHVRF
ncbi:MAG: hypothetical protein ABI686_14755 [Acidobacteriota bacterium]